MPNMDPQTVVQTSESKKRKINTVVSDVSEDENDVTFPRFLVVAGKDDQPIKYSIFAIQKFLQCGIGDVKTAKKLQNGNVLVEVTTKKESDRALQMTNWFDTPISVTPHRSLNTSRGVIRCREFRDCEDGEVVDALQSQGVTAVKHIMANRDGKMEPTNTFILTFNLPTPPKAVKAAYMKLTVEQFIPNPLRCYNCQKFGHGKTKCRRQAVCARCSQEGHQDNDCTNPQRCVNCSAAHPSYSKDCPEWQKQRDITQVKFERNISFKEAKQVVEQRSLPAAHAGGASGARRAGVTYSQACALQLQTSATQTDITWPIDSKLPFAAANLPLTKSTDTESQTEQTDGAVGGTTAASSSASKKNVNNPNYKTSTERSKSKI